MSLPIIGDIIQAVSGSVTAIVGTEKDKQDFQVKMRELDQAQDMAQIEVNKVEAASESGFKSNWRPAVGWCCVAGLTYSFLIVPIVPWVLKVSGLTDIPPLPTIDQTVLDNLLYALLGLSGMRTAEKVSSVMKK